MSLLVSDEADVLFVGDAMQHQGQIDAAHMADGTYDYSGYFSTLHPYIESADLAVVNFEAALGGAPYTGYPAFSAPDAYADALVDAGFDFFLTANNHILDRRDRGLRRTIATLRAKNIPYTGIYNNAAERDSMTPVIVDVAGFKIGILNYTYATNGIRVTTDAVVDYIDRKHIASDVRKARARGAELIAACMHWGEEYQLLPTKAQKSLATYLVDSLNVEMVIGGHPHVIQPMEMRRNANGTQSVVVYSLGNFISNMRTTDTRGGAMVRIHLQRTPQGQAYVSSATYRLVFTMPATKSRNFKLVPVEDCNDAEWRDRCRAFTRNAEAIFTKYNKGIYRDSTRIVPQ
jgi:poly-gamma-glutamate synthesis protein (capsule biosynthesis protein)